MLDTVLSSYKEVTFISIISSLFIEHDNTSLSLVTNLSFDSPVKALVSRLVSPLITIPSKGIFSPFLTIITSPILTSSGDTFTMSFFCFKLA